MRVPSDIAIVQPTAPVADAPDGTWFDTFVTSSIYSWEAFDERSQRVFVPTQRLVWLRDQGVAFGLYTSIERNRYTLDRRDIEPIDFQAIQDGVTIRHMIGIHDPTAAFWYKMRFAEPD